jgi:hypothetical protein
MSQDQEDLDLIARLKKHPQLFARMAGLLEVVENAGGDIKKAAEAELRVIEEVRQMGHEALQTWATGQVEKASVDANKREGVRSAGKKNLPGTAPSESLK